MSVDYVRQAYGLDVKRGARVRTVHDGNALGTVTRFTHYVWVRLDGRTRSRPYHPSDILTITDTTPDAAQRRQG